MIIKNRIKLLISPKDIDEAKIVIKQKDIDYIDCKNPLEGSLGANFPWVIKEMKKLIPPSSNQLLSATIGDFPYLPGSASLAALGAAYAGADIIKVGLRGPKNEFEGINLMKNVVKAVKSFNKEIKVVAAGYADKIRMQESPHFLSIPTIASRSGANIAMLDTYIKDGKSILDFLNIAQLKEFTDKAKKLGLEVALAGNLMKDSILKIKQVNPDIIGVRSIVCEGYDRQNGMIKEYLINELKSILYN